MSAVPRLKAEWCVTPARAWHAERMAPNVRQADRDELWSGWRSTPEDSLRNGLQISSHCWTALVNFQPVCMLGVVPCSLLGGSGRVWLVGTEAITHLRAGFLRRCRPHLGKIQSIYSHLSNHVAAKNVAAVAWLDWLGFEIQAPQPFGYDGEDFHYFQWSRNV